MWHNHLCIGSAGVVFFFWGGLFVFANSMYTRTERTPPSTRYANRTEWEIPYGDIKLGTLVGEGTYGQVYKGNWFGDVAVKKLKVANPTEEEIATFKNEVRATALGVGMGVFVGVLKGR